MKEYIVVQYETYDVLGYDMRQPVLKYHSVLLEEKEAIDVAERVFSNKLHEYEQLFRKTYHDFVAEDFEIDIISKDKEDGYCAQIIYDDTYIYITTNILKVGIEYACSN